jgi:hypothetical protein
MEQYCYEFYIWSDTLYIISFDAVQSIPVQHSKLLLILAITIVLGFGPRRGPWPYFRSFQTFRSFQMEPPLRQEEGSDYHW